MTALGELADRLVAAASVTHGLWYGRALCAFRSDAPPWPRGHAFVMATDVDAITCQRCKREAERIARGERG